MGGLVWGASIPAILLTWRYVIAGPKPMGSGRSRWCAATSGGIGGLLGGLVNTGIMLGGVSKDTLHRASWLPTVESQVVEAFNTSMFGFAYIVYGVLLGIGVGCSFHVMLMKGRRAGLENERAEPPTFEDLPRLAWYSLRWSAGRSIWIAFCMAMASMVLATILQPARLRSFASDGDSLVWRILGESISVYFGGLGIVIALFVGLLLLKKGIIIEGRDDFSVPRNNANETAG
jgi:hypothetical protein